MSSEESMSIIRKHNITLYGKVKDFNIVLRPLEDRDLPLLYKWNADPEVVYWSDFGNVEVFSEKSVDGIYGRVSQNAYCFLAEVNGEPIGDFWLQHMNIPEILEKYVGLDVRRFEASIGEKSYWGQGIGTAITAMLMEFAFCTENVDVIYNFTADYNIRSQRTLLRQGFQLCGEYDADEPLRGEKEYHYCLTRGEYYENNNKGECR